ncbi:MAG: hypothetical protein M1817_004344 [Caeruleum heppii]|nr:MAG: hypothetical protein M1817_004344 [Caeruleum heppii]
MARSHIALATASAGLFLLVLWQLLSTSGWPQIPVPAFSTSHSKAHKDEYQMPMGEESLSFFNDDDEPEQLYVVGVGKADITGPVVELNMMGYADPSQKGTGLKQRLYSRAFIVGDRHDPEARFVYLVLDTQSGDTAVRYGVLDGLTALGPEYAMYGQHNIALTGTHSHSGPGAWLNYLLPQITSRGFSKQSYQAIVDGTVLSIKRAHDSLIDGYLAVGHRDVEGANVNRSPYAYRANPEQERDGYGNDVDKMMTLLAFRRAKDGKDLGILTWFPVHGTSMLGNNTLITGDNKGVAADLFEKKMKNHPSGAAGFVAGFSQSNVGDTSPNVKGAFCEDGSGERCNFEDSTCGGKTGPCHGQGPYDATYDNGAKSCYEIGKKQYETAMDIYEDMISRHHPFPGVPIHGPISFFHSFRDFSNYTFPHPSNGTLVSTCPAALGYSFAAGTTDGPGAFDFKQNNSGAPAANPFWGAVRGFLKEPSEEQKVCHAPKPILLDVGEITRPYLWTPNVVDIQVLRLGQLIIIVSPGEATTMAGRRWKAAIKKTAEELRLSKYDPIVVLGGPANSYTHYIATEEEYTVQRYEGASTLYGPHTLNAYIHASTELIPYLRGSNTSSPDPGPSPPNHLNASLSFINGVIYDRAPLLKSFGDFLGPVDAKKLAKRRVNALATARFVGANPRNNLRLEGSYVVVEKRVEEEDENEDDGCGREYGKEKWRVVRDDSDWFLSFSWRLTSTALGTSEVAVVWECEEMPVDEGTYRLRYRGDSKAPFSGKITGFEGVSEIFYLDAGYLRRRCGGY